MATWMKVFWSRNGNHITSNDFFQKTKKIASNFRIETRKKSTPIIASQNHTIFFRLLMIISDVFFLFRHNLTLWL